MAFGWAASTAARPAPEPWQVQPLVFAEEPLGASTVQQQRGPVSLQEATRLAQSRFSGRVVRAETVVRGGRREHHIRILTDDNRVRNVRIDAETGRFL